MNFDSKSNVTLVITSCGRFDLLKKTVESFDKQNLFPIKEVIITEDSGSDSIIDYLPEHWKMNTKIFINNPKLGQMRSIDLAYENVETEYIFHCEDDWLFYRKGFIEESMVILESNKNILQVWLRDFEKDISKNYSCHYLGEKFQIGNINFFRLGCNDSVWKGFSLNPGLRRKADYLPLAPFYNSTSSDIREGEISLAYNAMGMFAVILEESAVEHIGWDNHILTEREIKERKKKKKTKIKYTSLGFILGCIFSILIFYFLKLL